MTTRQFDNNQEAQTAASPGSRLRQARINNNLDQEQIAKKLHLSKQQVEAIEQDDYTYVTALAYVRGHLRLYAKLVDLSVHEILKAFDALGLKEVVPPPPPTSFTQNVIKHAERKKSNIVKSLSMLILLFVLFAIAVVGLLAHHKREALLREALLKVQQPQVIKQPQSTTPPSAQINPQPLVTVPLQNSGPIPLAIPPAQPAPTSPAPNVLPNQPIVAPADNGMPRNEDHSTE